MWRSWNRSDFSNGGSADLGAEAELLRQIEVASSEFWQMSVLPLKYLLETGFVAWKKKSSTLQAADPPRYVL